MTRKQMIVELNHYHKQRGSLGKSYAFTNDEEVKREYEEIFSHINSNDEPAMIDILTEVVVIISSSEFSPSIVFRGAFVLVHLLKLYNIPYNRFTEDIDTDWGSNFEWENFYKKLPKLLTENSSLGMLYQYDDSNKEYSSDKMKLILKASRGSFDIVFSIDVSKRISTTIMELNISGVPVVVGDIYFNICDKLNVFATYRVGARIKDFYDLYLYSQFDGLEMDIIHSYWVILGYALPEEIFGLSPNNFARMKKPFDLHKRLRFEDISFEDVMARVLTFTSDIYESLLLRGKLGLIWDSIRGCWFE